MKKNLGQTQKENIKFNENKPRPEVRDDLHSSTNRGTNKGDDRIHTKKEGRKAGKGKP
jgi:hypothetical protein